MSLKDQATRRDHARTEGSFRDPSGFVFTLDGEIYRQVNDLYRDNYDLLKTSGLYASLINDGLLIPHEEVDLALARQPHAYKVIKPQTVPLISYPYEWCFSQLKDAALTTLAVQQRAMLHGMVLKDSSAFNIQFVGGRPMFIDTLSFERYVEGQPWVAYQQVCQHFLAPLALMSLTDVRLSRLLLVNIDGIPLDLASSLLPQRSKLHGSLLLHLHLHAKSQQKLSGNSGVRRRSVVSRNALDGLVSSLQSAIKKLKWQPRGLWADYYDETNYSADGTAAKQQIVAEFLDQIKPQSVWDLGANTGVFSRIASSRGIRTVAFDFDMACVERMYQEVHRSGDRNLLPLFLDLANPTPSIGWDHCERASFKDRGPADAIMCLAVLHHVAISNNVPFWKIADFLSDLGRFVVIEFVPKEDSNAQRLLTARADIFTDYNIECFEQSFQRCFSIERRVPIPQSGRVLYLLRRK